MDLPHSAVGSLMHEHQLILRAIADMRRTSEGLSEGETLDAAWVVKIVDFIRSYADRCHHGKEEDILFRELAHKDLAPEHATAMQELIDDHVWARAATGRLVDASAQYFDGEADALPEVAHVLRQLVEFYPVHIEKEDHGFFKPAMDYFDPAERETMAAAFAEFDRSLVHERYLHAVEELEARRVTARDLRGSLRGLDTTLLRDEDDRV